MGGDRGGTNNGVTPCTRMGSSVGVCSCRNPAGGSGDGGGGKGWLYHKAQNPRRKSDQTVISTGCRITINYRKSIKLYMINMIHTIFI